MVNFLKFYSLPRESSHGPDVHLSVVPLIPLSLPAMHAMGVPAYHLSVRVAEIGKMKWSGRFAWFIWAVVHLMSLLGFRNKMVVFINWFYRYFTFDRGTRIIIKRGAANIVKLRQSVLTEEAVTQ